MKNGTAEQNFLGYDNFGRVTASRFQIGGLAWDFPEYSWNTDGSLAAMTYPSGRRVSYSYDEAGRAKGLTGQSNGENATYVDQVGFAANGEMNSWRLDQLINRTRDFNSRWQTTGMGASWNTGQGAQSWQVGYVYPSAGNNGNPSAQTMTALGTTRTQNYLFDGLNRLRQFNEGTLEQKYVIDAYGNRAVREGGTIPRSEFTPKVPAGSTSEDDVTNQFGFNRWQGTGMQYDNAGNLIGMTASRSLLYDVENRMVKAVVGGVESLYSYDGEGRRVKKEDGFGTTHFVFDALGQMALETYQAKAGVAQTSEPTGRRYLIEDALGSTRVEMDSAGTNVRYHDYLPYGEDLVQGMNGRGAGYPAGGGLEAPGLERRRFTGKERDFETGLDFFGARYLRAGMGRFTGADPEDAFSRSMENPQRWNKYSYVLNNPLTRVDPDGRDDMAIGACIGNEACLAKQAAARGKGAEILVNAVRGSAKDFANQLIDAEQGLSNLVGFLTGGKVQVPKIENYTVTPEEESASLVLAVTTAMLPGGKPPKPRTVANLPGRTVVNENGVTVEHYYRGGDHGPLHLHVKGNGPNTRIGQMGKPLQGDPELSTAQREVVDANKSKIRSTVDKIMRWFSEQSSQTPDPGQD